MTVTETLDGLIKALEGRRRENDDLAVPFWIEELEATSQFLKKCEMYNDDD